MSTRCQLPRHRPHPADACSRRGQEGAQALEFAVLLPIVLAVFSAVLSYGLIFSVEHTLNAAAAEGARAAVGTRDDGAAVAAATAAATDQLQALGSHAANATVDPPQVADCAAPAGTRCVTVSVTYPWDTAPIVPELFGAVTPDLLTASSTVQLSQ